MNLIAISIVGVFVVGAALMAVMLSLIIMRNVSQGRSYRQSIARNVAEIPLGKLLSAHGLEIDDYLHRQRIVDVQAQIGQCSACHGAADCDRALSRSINLAPILAYCPNSTVLHAVKA